MSWLFFLFDFMVYKVFLLPTWKQSWKYHPIKPEVASVKKAFIIVQ